jgi:hypothetical protein
VKFRNGDRETKSSKQNQANKVKLGGWLWAIDKYEGDPVGNGDVNGRAVSVV